MIFVTDSIRWLSGTGVSSHRKMPANPGKIRKNVYATTGRRSVRRPPYWGKQIELGERGQALALLSTARSERSA